MTKNIISFAAFDGKEPNNTNSAIASYGNNRWSLSNIRQWLNSTKGAYQWWSPTHDYDTEPSSNYTEQQHNYTNLIIYHISDLPGFLSGFSSEILQHFATVQNVTALSGFYGADYETTQDKVFLASVTELFGYDQGGVQEGNHLSEKFVDDESRIRNSSYGLDYGYWTRSLHCNDSAVNYCHRGGCTFKNAYYIDSGCAPLVVLI